MTPRSRKIEGVDTMAGEHKRLGELVKAERRNKFGSIEQAIREAGVNRATWLRVENGQRVRDDSLSSIEHALGWTPGRAWRILAGDETVASTERRRTTDPVRDAIVDSGLSDHDKEILLAQLEVMRSRNDGGGGNGGAGTSTNGPSGESSQRFA